MGDFLEPEKQSERFEEQDSNVPTVVGTVMLFFDSILWLFVPDEFRVGQYAVTLIAAVLAVVGVSLVGWGTILRQREREAMERH